MTIFDDRLAIHDGRSIPLLVDYQAARSCGQVARRSHTPDLQLVPIDQDKVGPSARSDHSPVPQTGCHGRNRAQLAHRLLETKRPFPDVLGQDPGRVVGATERVDVGAPVTRSRSRLRMTQKKRDDLPVLLRHRAVDDEDGLQFLRQRQIEEGIDLACTRGLRDFGHALPEQMLVLRKLDSHYQQLIPTEFDLPQVRVIELPLQGLSNVGAA